MNYPANALVLSDLGVFPSEWSVVQTRKCQGLEI